MSAEDWSYDDMAELVLGVPEEGKLFWKARPLEMFKSVRDWKAWNTLYAGKPSFYSVDSKGYLHGNIGGQKFRAHRVMWLMYYYEWPIGEIDHIDGNRKNNIISNLRDVSAIVNRRNARMFSHNTSGVNGVYWNAKIRKWCAQIKINGWPKHLGSFTSIEDAASARKAADREAGFTERHGTPQ